MVNNPVVLHDAEEIEAFFVRATGMKPGYTQLSPRPAQHGM